MQLSEQYLQALPARTLRQVVYKQATQAIAPIPVVMLAHATTQAEQL